jgi:hypothetical protein
MSFIAICIGSKRPSSGNGKFKESINCMGTHVIISLLFFHAVKFGTSFILKRDLFNFIFALQWNNFL